MLLFPAWVLLFGHLCYENQSQGNRKRSDRAFVSIIFLTWFITHVPAGWGHSGLCWVLGAAAEYVHTNLTPGRPLAGQPPPPPN